MRQNGRDLRIKKDGTLIAVVNTKTVNVNTTPVDVTGDDDEGFTTYLDRPGVRQISADVSGFSTDEVLRDVAMGVGSAGSIMDDYTIEWLSADGSGTVVYTIAGKFVLTNFSETGATAGGLEFSANLASSGPFEKVTA